MSVFHTEKIDFTTQPAFFGPRVNIARYDKQRYRIFETLTDKQLGFFWRPEEVDISRDSKDFKNLTELYDEKIPKSYCLVQRGELERPSRVEVILASCKAEDFELYSCPPMMRVFADILTKSVNKFTTDFAKLGKWGELVPEDKEETEEVKVKRTRKKRNKVSAEESSQQVSPASASSESRK